MKANEILSSMPVVFQDSSFVLLHSYISKRWHKTKINISSWTELTQEVQNMKPPEIKNSEIL